MKNHFLHLFFFVVLHFSAKAQCSCDDGGEIIAKYAYNQNNSAINLSWKTKNICSTAIFEISRRVKNSPYQTLKRVSGNEFHDDGIETGKTYEYLIECIINGKPCIKKTLLAAGRAVDEDKFSSYSLNLSTYKRLNVLSITPMQKTVQGNARIRAEVKFLDWNYPSFDNLDYVVVFGERIVHSSNKIENVDYSKPWFDIPYNATYHKTCRLAIIQKDKILGISEEIKIEE